MKTPMREKYVDEAFGIAFINGVHPTTGEVDVTIGQSDVITLERDIAVKVVALHDQFRESLYELLCADATGSPSAEPVAAKSTWKPGFERELRWHAAFCKSLQQDPKPVASKSFSSMLRSLCFSSVIKFSLIFLAGGLLTFGGVVFILGDANLAFTFVGLSVWNVLMSCLWKSSPRVEFNE